MLPSSHAEANLVRPSVWISFHMATALGGVLGGASGAALGASLSYAVQQLILRSVAKSSAGTETSIIAIFQRLRGQ